MLQNKHSKVKANTTKPHLMWAKARQQSRKCKNTNSRYESLQVKRIKVIKHSKSRTKTRNKSTY